MNQSYLFSISVEHHPNDFMVYLNNNIGLWGCGKTVAEAIGDAVRTHVEHLNIDVNLVQRMNKRG